MGRQLPIVATRNDERQLLSFIATLSPIRVFVSQSINVGSIWVNDWDERDIPGYMFQIWPTVFSWTPEYKQTGGPRCPRDFAGRWYVSNSNVAPVIELSRPAIDGKHGGRVYWARDFSAPHGLDYDVAKFDDLVNRVWNWIRRFGRRRKAQALRHSPYYLPEAWQHFGSRGD